MHTWSVAAAEAAALTVAGLAAAQRLGVGSVRWVLQGVVASGVGGRVWVVTREAVEAGGCGVRGLAQAPVWGLGKVCGLEHPGEWGGLIDVAWGDEAAGAAAVVATVAGDGWGEEIAVRGGARFVARVVRDGER